VRIARIAIGDEVHLARLEGEDAVLLAPESAHPAADALREALAADVDLGGSGRRVPLADVTLLAPVARPSKVIAVGLNYADHARESGAAIPPAPLLFAKAPSSIVGPDVAIDGESGNSQEVDYEAELAVVIGRRAAADVTDPMSHVLGYTICNDVSARDAQLSDGQWMRGKSFDTFCPLGPWIVTADELPDPQSLRIGCTVSGEKLQDGTTAEMIFSVAEIVTYVARFMTLEPGDVIATGTPYGVGFARNPQRFLRDGDEVTCWVEGIGELTNPVVVRGTP
jgi:2-keto-4-pentenoate hydratase/2-oxohepta-3-ene-1,7-dioic acid hydratase in catechol pathway